MAESIVTRAGDSRGQTLAAETAATEEEVRRQFESTREALKESGERAYLQAKSTVLSAAEEQKRRAAHMIEGVARSLHDAARSLGSEEQPTTAHYANLAADQLERAASLLQERSVDDLVANIEHFARRQPVVFLGGALAVGFVVARFLKSGEPREEAGLDEASLYGSDDIGVAMARQTTSGAYSAPQAGAAPGDEPRGL